MNIMSRWVIVSLACVVTYSLNGLFMPGLLNHSPVASLHAKSSRILSATMFAN